MDEQEKFFLDQIQAIQQAITAKEDKFEKLQQANRQQVKWACGDSSEKEDNNHM